MIALKIISLKVLLKAVRVHNLKAYESYDNFNSDENLRALFFYLIKNVKNVLFVTFKL